MKHSSGRRTHSKWRLVGAAVLPMSLVLGALLPVSASAAGGTVSVVAYSTPKPAYAALIKAFNATKAGAG